MKRVHIIENATSGSQSIIIKQGSGATVTIANGQVKIVFLDGAGSGAAVTDALQDLAVPDLFVDDDLSLQSDGAIVNFGVDSDVTLTHVADTGLTITNTNTGDNKPVVLQLKSEEDAIIADEVIASIEMAAGDSDGTDGATVAAGIHAIAEGTFAADANATKLVFTTGVSETAAASATAKMTLSSAGLLTIADDLVIKSGGTIGGAGDTDLLTLGSSILTVAGEVSMTTLDIGGTNVTATATELNKLDGVTATTTELNYTDVTTLGTTEASKAVTADANGVVTFDNGTIEEATTITSSSNAATLDLRAGNVFEHTLTENVTYTFSNPASSGRVSSFVLKIKQDGSGSGFTVTFPSSVDFAGGSAPTLTSTANAIDTFVIFTTDGGTIYNLLVAGQDIK